MSAVQYAGLVGKYVRMERPSTADELLSPGHPPTTGMECVVASVEDVGDGLVAVVADYGYAFVIQPAADESWQFTIWPDEETRLANSADRMPPVRLEYAVGDPDSSVHWTDEAEAREVADGDLIWLRETRIGQWKLLDTGANRVV